MARLGRARPNVPIIERNTLVDDPVLTTPKPIVVTGSSGRRGRPNQVRIFRATTVVPIPNRTFVVSEPVPVNRRSTVIISRAPFIAEPEVFTATPKPIVVIGTSGRRGVPNLWALTVPQVQPLADPGPVPVPVVVVPAYNRRPNTQAIITRTAPAAIVPPVPGGTDVDICVGPPEIHWQAGSPIMGWDAGPPIVSWNAQIVEDC